MNNSISSFQSGWRSIGENTQFVGDLQAFFGRQLLVGRLLGGIGFFERSVNGQGSFDSLHVRPFRVIIRAPTSFTIHT